MPAVCCPGVSARECPDVPGEPDATEELGGLVEPAHDVRLVDLRGVAAVGPRRLGTDQGVGGLHGGTPPVAAAPAVPGPTPSCMAVGEPGIRDPDRQTIVKN